MTIENGQILFNDGSGGSVPAINRSGGAQFAAFTCPPFPKWVAGPDGKDVLVKTAEEEAQVAAQVEKAPKAK